MPKLEKERPPPKKIREKQKEQTKVKDSGVIAQLSGIGETNRAAYRRCLHSFCVLHYSDSMPFKRFSHGRKTLCAKLRKMHTGRTTAPKRSMK